MTSRTKPRRLAFLDTETTGLHRDRRAWEVGLIVRDLDANTQSEPQRWFIRGEDLDLPNAQPIGLVIGGFYDRHPEYARTTPEGSNRTPVSEARLMRHYIEPLTRGAHIVGAVPNFDTEVLTAAFARAGIAPSWHYHLIDVEALAVGHLARWCMTDGERTDLPALPWNSDDLSRMLGVEPAPPELRHTAAGDADWAMRLFDAATAGAYALRETS